MTVTCHIAFSARRLCTRLKRQLRGALAAARSCAPTACWRVCTRARLVKGPQMTSPMRSHRRGTAVPVRGSCAMTGHFGRFQRARHRLYKTPCCRRQAVVPRLTCDTGVASPRLERIMVREARIYEPCKPWHAQHCEISGFFPPHSRLEAFRRPGRLTDLAVWSSLTGLCGLVWWSDRPELGLPGELLSV